MYNNLTRVSLLCNSVVDLLFLYEHVKLDQQRALLEVGLRDECTVTD